LSGTAEPSRHLVTSAEYFDSASILIPMTKHSSAGETSSATPMTGCPVEQAIHIIGGKWKMLVLRSLLLNGPQRYNELLASVTGISPKELTRNLGELASSGLIARGQSGTVRTAPYTLTQLGKGLMPAFRKLLVWGRNLNPAR
jgi:DNA-binding HxlR family transcriptional regulator